ncbi:PIR protein [Plasmodium vivax]|uniref:VIR protein n=1 Tax=Plasmodium vivax TaxID=5855 RepID=A0A565A4D6_PLAVI|nr:PIR protein [Plasmodium vivax]
MMWIPINDVNMDVIPLGSSSAPSSSSRNVAVAGDVKAAGVGKDKGVQRSSNNLAGSAVSQGLTRSTSARVCCYTWNNFLPYLLQHGKCTIDFTKYECYSSRLKSRFPKRKRKKKIFEHNYYEEYEKELARYESENESLDSQSDRYYLNYQPEGDYDY